VISALWGNTAYCSVKLSGEDLLRYSNNGESVDLRKNVRTITILLRNDVTITTISQSLPHIVAENQLAWIQYEEITLLNSRKT